MFKAIGAFFNVLISLFSAAETAANSLNIIAKVGEDLASDLRENSTHERELKRMEHRAKVASRAKMLGIELEQPKQIAAE